MKALDVNEGIRIFKKRDQKAYQNMSKNRKKFLNNITLTKVTDFFDENIKYTRDEVTDMLQAILKNRQYKFENRESVESALESYSRSKEPFSECLNDSVNQTYHSSERQGIRTNYITMIKNLMIKWHPAEASIRTKAPSNLPIHF